MGNAISNPKNGHSMASYDMKHLTEKHGYKKATEILLLASALHQESKLRIKGGIVSS